MFSLIISILIASSVTSKQITPPIVNLPNLGQLEGEIKKSEIGKTFYSFQGVPYAQPPVGQHRFEEPLPLKPWTNVLKANTIIKCLQYVHLSPPIREDPIQGDEDCLYLNIYTPFLDVNKNLNVIVFIHGGAFTFNCGGFQQPDYLLNHDVVYVSLNYRLGPLGFLSTEDDVVPGNNGLKDQIAALNWIKNNIKYFGGNSSSITITGNSAGGASVQLHYLIPQSKGLFHKGFSQSGSALNPWVIYEKPLEKAKKLAHLIECPVGSSREMVECMKTRHGRQIMESIKHFQPWHYNPFTPFGVVVDSWSSKPLLKYHPYQLLKNKEVYDVPWIASFVKSEGLYPAAEFYRDAEFLKYISTKWEDVMPYIMHYNDTVLAEKTKAVSNKIKQYYFGSEEVSKKSFNKLVEAISDRLYIVDIRKAVCLHSQAISSPVYLYYFTHRGSHSRSDRRSLSKINFGASHGDDASYIFQMNLDTHSNLIDKSVSDFLIHIWLSVADTGIPDVGPVSWTPVTKSSHKLEYLEIASPTNITMRSREMGNSEFWNSLPFQENEHLISF